MMRAAAIALVTFASAAALDAAPSAAAVPAGPTAPVIVDRPTKLTAKAIATFAFVHDDPRAHARCRVDRRPSRPCVSTYRTGPLPDGRHRFTVTVKRRSDAAVWTVDATAPPAPAITRLPRADATSAAFEIAGSRLSCGLDGAAPEFCASRVEYRDLAPGAHSFSVTARDRAGNHSASERAWTVSVAPDVQTGASEPRTTSARVTGHTASGAVYRFEYGPTSRYGSRTLPQTAPPGGGATATLTGLRPETTYHYRLVAGVCGGCPAGTAEGADATVTTTAVTTYQNPVYGGLADPMVLGAGGGYYAYGTGERFPMARSTDLVHWTALAPAMTARPAWVPRSPAGWNPWAPSVLRRDGPCPGTASPQCFVMYYTGLNTTLEPDVNCLGVAVSTSPAGPFGDTGILDTDPPSVDSEDRPIGCGDDAGHSNVDAAPFVDPATGRIYLYLSTGHDPSRAWRRAISVIPLTADGLRAAGPRVALFSFTEPWEGEVVEGPWVIRRGERYFLFYSGGTFTDATYGLGYAYASSPTGPFIKYARLLGTVPLVVGPGGASILTTPDRRDWAAYHGRAVPGAARTMRLDPLIWDNDTTPSRVTVSGPSTGPQPRP